MCPLRSSGDAALGVTGSEGESVLSPVGGEIRQLLGVDGSPSLLPDHLDGILVLEAQFDQSNGHHDGRASQSRDTVDGDRGIGVRLEALAQQSEPGLDDLVRRGSPVVELQVRHCDPLCLQAVRLVRRFTHADHFFHVALLQLLCVCVVCEIRCSPRFVDGEARVTCEAANKRKGLEHSCSEFPSAAAGHFGSRKRRTE